MERVHTFITVDLPKNDVEFQSTVPRTNFYLLSILLPDQVSHFYLNKLEMNFNPNKHEFNKFYKKNQEGKYVWVGRLKFVLENFESGFCWRKISSQGYLEEKVTSRSTVKTNYERSVVSSIPC